MTCGRGIYAQNILDHTAETVWSCSVPPQIVLSRDADALDAVVCVLAGADFLRGDAHPPDDPESRLRRKAGFGVGSGHRASCKLGRHGNDRPRGRFRFSALRMDAFFSAMTEARGSGLAIEHSTSIKG